MGIYEIIFFISTGLISLGIKYMLKSLNAELKDPKIELTEILMSAVATSCFIILTALLIALSAKYLSLVP